MKTLTTILLTMLSGQLCFSQHLTGNELLNKAIEYHDPNYEWSTFKAELVIELSTPDGKERMSTISMDLQEEYFALKEQTDITIERVVHGFDCILKLNSNTEFTDEEKEKHRLTCSRNRTMRDYYTYLYGLPMKLKDPGTIIHETVERRIFQGNEYNVLKVTYEKEVGSDSWYFYFDINTHEMKAYQFFHNKEENDGEFILLSDVEEYRAMKIPKVRGWYTNKDNKYLGTDSLLTIEPW